MERPARSDSPIPPPPVAIPAPKRPGGSAIGKLPKVELTNASSIDELLEEMKGDH